MYAADNKEQRGHHMDKPKLSYWLVAGLGLIWNLMGVLNYIVQTNPDSVAQMPESYQALIANRPGWATAVFGLAVFGGAVGCILLLLRRRVAVYVLIVSLGAVAVTLVQAVGSTGFSSDLLMSTGMSLIVAIVLWWTGRTADRAGWLR